MVAARDLRKKLPKAVGSGIGRGVCNCLTNNLSDKPRIGNVAKEGLDRSVYGNSPEAFSSCESVRNL